MFRPIAILAALTVVGASLFATSSAQGASTLSQNQATTAALTQARNIIPNFHDSDGSTIASPMATCAHGRLSATAYFCTQGWSLLPPQYSALYGDTLLLTQSVKVIFTNGHTTVKSIGGTCLNDQTAGFKTGNCH